MSRQSPGEVKDAILGEVSTSIKQLQAMLSDLSNVEQDDVVGGENPHVQELCEHLDRILMHGVKEYEAGYWPVVKYFTRSEAVRMLSNLSKVTTDVGRGRAWLYLALNEQAMESYVRMFIENQDVTSEHYLRDAFLRDCERLLLLQTLVSGLDFISFDLLVDSDYLDYGPTLSASRASLTHSTEVATATQKPSSTESTGFSLSTILSKFGSHDTAEKSHDPESRASEEEIDTRKESDSIPISGHSRLVPELDTVSPQVSVLQRMQLPIPSSLEECDSGNGTLDRRGGEKEEEDEVVERVSKPGRQRRSKVKHKKKRSKHKDAAASLKASAAGVSDSHTEAVDVQVPVKDDADDVSTPFFNSGMEREPTLPEVLDTLPVLEPDFENETRNRSDAIADELIQEVKDIDATEPTNEIAVNEDIQDEVMTPPLLELDKPRPPDPAHFDHSLEQAPHDETDLAELPSNQPLTPPPTRQRAETEPFELISSGEYEHRTDSAHKSARLLPPPKPVLYEGLPERPTAITEDDCHAADIRIDDNTRLVFSLDVLYSTDEKIERLIQIAMPVAAGQKRNAYILISNEAVYLLRNDGIQGLYCREVGIRYSEFEYVVIGLCWQSLILVYRAAGLSQRSVLLTGSEAVSRSVVNTLRGAAASCPGFHQSIPLNRDDDTRIEAIERELIKLGSHTSMEIIQYSLVNWEQLSGEAPPTALLSQQEKISIAGTLLVKSTNMIGMSAWKLAYFRLKSGSLYQYNSEEDHVIRATYQIRNSQGCMRAKGENKSFALSVLGKEGAPLVLAMANEEELTRWMQALCEAVIESEVSGPISPTHKNSFLSCAVLLTQNKIHLLVEDWRNQSVQLVTSCEVTDVNGISVDSSLPLYCTISYDHGVSQGVWLMCFSSEYELGKFERALATTWTDLFQIQLSFSEVRDALVRERAHKAVELMQHSRFRSDSITRGRTDFSFSAVF